MRAAVKPVVGCGGYTIAGGGFIVAAVLLVVIERRRQPRLAPSGATDS